MQKYLVIVAGGSGTRMGTDTPKQFLCFSGKPVLMHTIERFISFDPIINILLVLPEQHHNNWKALCKKYRFSHPHTVITGGKERFHSVKNGLRSITENSLVAIHDGVRPLVSHQTIERCFDTAQQSGTAIPVVPVTESVRQTHESGSSMLDRTKIMMVQTPQVFQSEIIQNAYKSEFNSEFTDDASVVEKSGGKINLVEGNIENIKITRPIDLQLAGLIYTDLGLE
ncbi:MAG: 2-C-methyl-D-erythritol 4-phosphate cytidylyltransferase [Bacteroidales bacterium]|nr:2-C-methyl-D-erythritol 4-phosphate cytidylyltransferase [Bacteroidales bacterium]